MSEKGRPYCKRAGMFLHEKESRRDAHPQCESCRFIIYIGCPTFEPELSTKINKSQDYIRWWYGHEKGLHEPIQSSEED